MLLVRTYVAPSAIHGLGLFAGEAIAAGTCIWRRDPRFLREFTDAEVIALPYLARLFLDTYGWRERSDGPVLLCLDNARFTNHSPTPNTYSDWLEGGVDATFAAAPIPAGVEITEDYGTYDADFKAWAEDHLKPEGAA